MIIYSVNYYCLPILATFNTRTLNRIGQLPELTASVIDHNTDIIYLEERRYTHSENIKYHYSANGWTVATASTGKNSVKTTIGGVGMLIGPQAPKSLNSIERIQPRVIVATFNGNPSATIINCYSHTNVSEESELITYYDELSSLVRIIPKYNVLVIGGDMNVQNRKNGNHKFSQHNSSNRNGQYLRGFTIENRLTCLNTNFQKVREKFGPTYT